MESSPLVYAMLAGLAIALLYAMFTDASRRVIPNWLTGGVALAAPLFWWASGFDPWPDMALQLVLGLVILCFFAAFFAFGMMGGGDVKLLAALALWLPWRETYALLLLSSLAGLVVTAIFWARHRRRGDMGRARIPYGIAIALAGLWVIGERLFNQIA